MYLIENDSDSSGNAEPDDAVSHVLSRPQKIAEVKDEKNLFRKQTKRE